MGLGNLEMPPGPLDEVLLSRYLAALGISRRRPGLEALREVVAAQITHIPFENISKLWRWKRLRLTGLPTIEMFLEGIEQFRFGGTCYSNNYYFHLLLHSLGYKVKLCGADMANPDVHMVNFVTVEGREYLVDVGYAAPFLAPLPRDLADDYAIALGRDRYVLRPQDAKGNSRLELYRDGVLKHGYLAKPTPKKLEEFSRVVSDSFRPRATFLNSVLLARFYPDRSVVIHNLTLIESQGTRSSISSLSGRDELIARVEECFGIPRDIVAEAIQGLGEFEDAWT